MCGAPSTPRTHFPMDLLPQWPAWKLNTAENYEKNRHPAYSQAFCNIYILHVCIIYMYVFMYNSVSL